MQRAASAGPLFVFRQPCFLHKFPKGDKPVVSYEVLPPLIQSSILVLNPIHQCGVHSILKAQSHHLSLSVAQVPASRLVRLGRGYRCLSTFRFRPMSGLSRIAASGAAGAEPKRKKAAKVWVLVERANGREQRCSHLLNRPQALTACDVAHFAPDSTPARTR